MYERDAVESARKDVERHKKALKECREWLDICRAREKANEIIHRVVSSIDLEELKANLGHSAEFSDIYDIVPMMIRNFQTDYDISKVREELRK